LADEREARIAPDVDQLGRARRGFGQDAEPGERVLPEVLLPALHQGTADAARTVRADHDVGGDLVSLLVVGVGDARLLVDVLDQGLGDAVPQVSAVPGAGAVQVHEDLGLGVEPAGGTDQRLEVDPVTETAEAQVDAFVLMTLGQDPVGDPRLDQEADAVTL